MLRIKKHPNGPELPEALKDKTFRSYVDMANFAEDHDLLPGVYWVRNDKGNNLLTAIRELNYKNKPFHQFHVEGRGNV
jgi:hypothetical protein